MWQVTLIWGAVLCLAHVHRLIVSLSQPKFSPLRSRIKISKFITCCQLFWTASDKQLWELFFWREAQKCSLSFLYLVICLRSFLTFHSLRSLVMHMFWGTCFDSSKCFSNILQAWNCRFPWSTSKCDEWWWDTVCHRRLYGSVCGVRS